MSETFHVYLQIDDGEILLWDGFADYRIDTPDDAPLEPTLSTGVHHGYDEDFSGRVIVQRLWHAPQEEHSLGIAIVNARGTRPDGSRFGILGFFRRGLWGTLPDGCPIFRVWERIA